jgi:hypothetical protein
MKEILEALRGPALGVVVMIILLAGVLVITALAALIAQIGLFMRFRPQQAFTPPADREQRSAGENRALTTRRNDSGSLRFKNRVRP